MPQQHGQHATFAAARQAFFDSAFERSLELCDMLPIGDDSMQYEIALLRARVLLRLGRAEKAIDALRSCTRAPMSPADDLRIQMLFGTAYVRLGQVERGEALLVKSYSKAGESSTTLRAELAVNLGIARFQLGDHEEAERLFSSNPATNDIIDTRALQYLAWVAFARGDFDTAVARFHSALDAMERSKRYDYSIEANILQGLAALYTELLQTEHWPRLRDRIRTFDWSVAGLARPRFWAAMYASMLGEITGDAAAAREWAREAELAAPSSAYRAMAQCRTAAIFRGLGQADAHAEFIVRARSHYDSLNLGDLETDQKQLPLFLAEEMTYVNAHAESIRLVRQYQDIVEPTIRRTPGDDRFVALVTTLEASERQSSGDVGAAIRLFSKAFCLFQKANYRRRATAVALRLARLTGAARYVAYAKAALVGADRGYWMVAELAKLDSAAALSATKAELAILRLAAEGKTYKEIAVARGGSWRTVRNRMQVLFAKLGASSKGEAVAIALRRGLITAGADGMGEPANEGHLPL